jgi:spore coat polysaccharide biosynthesis protein SpsF
MGSTRLPGKTMASLLGKPLLYRVLERIRQARAVNEIVVATSVNPADDVIASWCEREGFSYYRGSEDNVLSRVVEAARTRRATGVVQLGADCPLYDPDLIDELVGIFLSNRYDYVANDMKLTYPEGIDAHVISMAALEEALAHAKDPRQLEDVPRYIWDHPERFAIFNLEAPAELFLPELRVTVDYPEDLELIQRIYEALYPKNPLFRTRDVIDFVRANPHLIQINAHCEQRSAAYLS